VLEYVFARVRVLTVAVCLFVFLCFVLLRCVI